MTRQGDVQAKLAGVFAPLCIPFTEDEDVDHDALRHNLEIYAADGRLGSLTLGSNGENRSLTEDEQLRVPGEVVRRRGRGRR